MKKTCLFQIIIFLTLYSTQACPYKNIEQNLLSEENFYQSIQIQRNKNEEESKSNIGLYFWIEDDPFFTPKVLHQFQSPLLYDQVGDGNLILTIGDEKETKYLFYQKEEQEEQFCFLQDLENKKLENLGVCLNIDWRLLLFVIYPKEDKIIFQLKENTYEIHTIFINFNIINISLGGLLNDYGLNLDIYHGRFTKLEIMKNFIFDKRTYSHLLGYCFLPQKYLIDIGVYQLNKNNCSNINQFKCAKCQDGVCLYCDQDFLESANEVSKCVCGSGLVRYFHLEQEYLEVCVSASNTYRFINLIEEELLFLLLVACLDILIPFQTSKTVGCVECLLNQNIWYKDPICKSDFIAEDSNYSYKYYERKEKDYDVFIIDDINQLVHLIGVQRICQVDMRENCFQIKNKHLNQIVFVQCKINFKQYDNACMAYDDNCLEYQKNECSLCKIGSYLSNGQCLKCQTNCLTCFQNKESYICTKCIENFAILNNSCQKCGESCEHCVSEYDKQSNDFFLRCLRCINDSKYYLAFDGINCLQNLIANCQYAFQALEDNISVSTLDYQFQRQLNKNNIVTFCSRCFDYYIFIFSLRLCLNFENNQCIYGYASTFKYENAENKQTQKENIKCLITNQPNSNCSQIQNCEICQYQEANSQFFCLKCIQGYYFNTFSNQCYLFHHSCNFCLWQNKHTKDSWKLNVLPFYYELIENPYNHPYIKYAQSLNENDYEVVCLSWAGNINQDCHSINGCSKCDNQNNKICAGCASSTWTIENQQCNICPTQCNVCKQRSQEEILKLNPYYDKRDTQQSAYKCLQAQKQFNYYDREINQFIQCDKYKQGCKKTFIIKYILDCYPFSLIQPRSMNDFYDQIYDLAMYQKAKKIIVLHQSIKPLTCNLTDTVAKQVYNERLFWLLEAELQINCLHKVIWNVEGNIKFERFSKISISGLTINIIKKDIQRQFIFQSLKFQQIYFQNVVFQHYAQSKDNFQLCFFNAVIISFINSSFYNFNLVKDISFIKVHPVNFNKTISFISTNFIGFQMINSVILNFQNEEKDKLELKNLQIDGSFFNSSVIISESSNRLGEIHVENITIQNSVIYNCYFFLSFITFKHLYIYQLTIFRVNLTNSSIIQLTEYNFIQNININYCHLFSEVCIIENTNDYHIKTTQFRDVSITQNTYSMFTKFFKINRYDSIFSEFQLDNIILKNNLIYELNSDINIKEPTYSLIFIEADIIQCNHIFIERGFGLNEFAFSNIYSLNFSNALITQGTFYRKQGIHENLDCFLRTCGVRLNGISILIYSAQHVQIQALILNQVQSVDYPIIHYVSASDAILIRKETLILSSINFNGNALIQTKLKIIAALIQIDSFQKLEILVNNSIFSRNILQVYPQYYFDNIALIFYINAQNSLVHFSSVIFKNNTVINSQASILYLSATKINIQNCSFYQNNIFLYEHLRPHLNWPFYSEQVVYIENLQQIYKIQSVSGNGYFRTESLLISDSSIFAGQGNKATSFYLCILNNAIITIKNVEFYSNYLDLYEGIQKGGVIYVDCAIASIFQQKQEISQSNKLTQLKKEDFCIQIKQKG